MESHPTTLSYATPTAAVNSGKRPWVAAGLVLFAGLALIVLGGCFLIGVLAIYTPIIFNSSGVNPPPNSGGVALSVVLYILAFVCFVGAVTLIFIGLKWLRKIAFS